MVKKHMLDLMTTCTVYSCVRIQTYCAKVSSIERRKSYSLEGPNLALFIAV